MAIQGLVHDKPYGKFVAFDIAIDQCFLQTLANVAVRLSCDRKICG
jgi:hypothetical protein